MFKCGINLTFKVKGRGGDAFKVYNDGYLTQMVDQLIDKF